APSRAGSPDLLTLTGCRRRLDRVQHAMARHRVVERGAEMRSLAVVAGDSVCCRGWVHHDRRIATVRPLQRLDTRSPDSHDASATWLVSTAAGGSHAATDLDDGRPAP